MLALAVAASASNLALFMHWNSLAIALPAFFWAGVTNIGSTTGAFALLAGVLAWRPRWTAAALLAMPAGGLFTHGLKESIVSPRPAAVLQPEQLNIIGDVLRTSSFPSGHSATAFGVAAAVALCSLAAGKRPIAWVAIIVAAVVAYSRVAVGAHWPIDVLAGAAGGWLCGAIGFWWSGRWTFWKTNRGTRALAALMALASAYLFFEQLGYPQGLWAQYTLAAWGLAGALFALGSGTRRSLD